MDPLCVLCLLDTVEAYFVPQSASFLLDFIFLSIITSPYLSPFSFLLVYTTFFKFYLKILYYSFLCR